MKKKLLLVTRKYPPIKGGMEQYSYDLYTNLSKKMDVTLLANTKGNKFILPFYIKTFFYLLFNSRKFTNVHFCDGALGVFLPVVKSFSKSKASITIHGLDIVLKNKLYQLVIPKTLEKADKVICVSNATIDECTKRGIDRKKCVFIPNGINFEELKTTNLKLNQIEKKFNLSLKNKSVLFTVGRLIKRKGHEWFISDVMTKLEDDYIYIIAGEGPEKDNILECIKKHSLDDKVKLIGKVSDEEKVWFYKNSKYFIMPNIHVEGDMEGFGIVAIEAAAYGLPVIASNIEGIKDAVIDGKTGWLVEEKDSTLYLNQISKNSPLEPFDLSNFFDWKFISKQYQLIK